MFLFSIENKNLDRIELEGWITKDVAEMIFSKYNKTYDQMKAYALSDDFKPFELDGFQLSAKIKMIFDMQNHIML